MKRPELATRAGRRLPGGRAASLAMLLLAALGVAAVAKSAFLVSNVADGRVAEAAPSTGLPPSEPQTRLPEPEAGPADAEGAADTATESVGGARDGTPGGRPGTEPDLGPTELEILQTLAERRRALDERERQLDLRAEMLETAEAKVAEELARLERLHTAIEEAIDGHEKEEAAKIARLVKIYQSMRPKAAAAIFNRLDMPVLLEVVARMSETKSSAVIARMDPARARELTAKLAERSELPDLAP